MARSIPKFRARIGKQRIPSTDTSTLSGFTRDVRGQIDAVIKNYLAFIDHMEGVSANILYNALEPVFDQSQSEVPIKTGALKASGYLVEQSRRGRAEIEIGYGRGGNPPYAALVHENLRAYHFAPTKAKFLEDPIIQQATAIQERILDGVEEASGVK